MPKCYYTNAGASSYGLSSNGFTSAGMLFLLPPMQLCPSVPLLVIPVWQPQHQGMRLSESSGPSSYSLLFRNYTGIITDACSPWILLQQHIE